MSSAILRPGDRPWLHLGLLLLTLGTTFFTFWFAWGGGDGSVGEQLGQAAAYALALVFILGAHEMGHYAYARLHDVDTTLPYFIPFPLGAGTLGAVIRIRGRIPHLNALVDIGAAGPIAGLIVAIPLLAIGLSQSVVVDAPVLAQTFPRSGSGLALLSELGGWLLRQVTGEAAPAGVPGRLVSVVLGDNLLMRGLVYAVLGPLPEGKDVLLGPLVLATWFGLLVTMLNLMPIGQLDGGHVAFALLGTRARWLGRAAALLLLVLTLFMSWSWLLWLVVTTKFIGFGHPEVTDPSIPLTPGRKLVAVLCLVAFVLCIVPVPVTQVILP